MCVIVKKLLASASLHATIFRYIHVRYDVLFSHELVRHFPVRDVVEVASPSRWNELGGYHGIENTTADRHEQRGSAAEARMRVRVRARVEG
jgi:hypothetical protein